MTTFFRRLWRRLKYRGFERDLRDEIAVHRSMAEDALRAEGLGPDRARLESARQMGNTVLERERSRAVWVPPLIDELLQDARYARRSLWRQKGFTVTSVVMLTIGIGLVAGFYTLFNGLFVRGWNLPDSDRLVVVNARRAVAPVAGEIQDGMSMGAFHHVSTAGRAADYVALAFDYFRIRATAGVDGAFTPGLFASENFVRAMRVPIELGQAPSADPTDPPAVLISHRVWRRIFDSDPNVVGRTLWASGAATTVSGVMAEEFESLGPRPIDLVLDASDALVMSRRSMAPLIDDDACCVLVAGRLRDGWTRLQAEQELAISTAQYRQAARLPALTVSLADTTAGRGLVQRSNGQTIVLTLSLVGLACAMVWVLACANVGNLYLARSLRRRGEIAVRLALGASRARVVRQLVTEGGVLGLLSGSGALALTLSVPFVFNLIDDGTPLSMFPTDWRVAVVAGAAAAAASLLVSLAPALQTTRAPWRSAASTMTPGTNRLRGLLLAAQIAVAMALLVGAALLTHAVTAAINLETDYALRTTTAISFEPPAIPSIDDIGREAYDLAIESRRQAIRRVVTELQAAAGLSLGLANASPGNDGLDSFSTAVQEPDSEVYFRADLIPMSEAAFRVLDVPLVGGRFASDDPAAAEAVVNERLAAMVQPSGEVLGKAIVVRFDNRRYTIVGVVRDAHLTGFDRVEPLVHTAARPDAPSPVLLARTGPGLEQRVQAIVKAAAPDIRARIEPLSNTLRATLNAAAAGAAAAGGLGAVALLLAMLGVFTVFAYIVEERRRDVGIRLALGASRRQIRRTMFRATRGALVGGLAAGLGLSMAGGYLMRSFLFGLSPLDPSSYAAALLLLLASAIVATAIPIRRAMRLDPVVILKGE